MAILKIMSKTNSVYSFKKRTFIFLILLVATWGAGVGLLWNSQSRSSRAQSQVNEIIMPVNRLVENARLELTLQIQELSLAGAHSPPGLSPSVKALLSLYQSPFLPRSLKSLFDPWAEEALRFQGQKETAKNAREALPVLRSLKAKTEFLRRALEHNLTRQFVSAAEKERENLVSLAGLFLVGLALSLLFALGFARWTRPLTDLSDWLKRHDGAALEQAPPPRAIPQAGLLAPPSEVQELVQRVRGHLLQFVDQKNEVERRLSETRESERAIGTLFAMLHQLTRHNEELLKELIKKERLASMSEMAAELAHEIRNPLNSMNLKLELLRDELGTKEQEILDRVLAEIDRLDALTESHLRTTRAQLQVKAESQVSHLNKICLEVVDLIKPEAEQDKTTLQVLPLLRDEAVEIPENVLRAVLVNLVKNGREAMEGATRKVLQVKLVTTATQWRISVLDTGCGFPQNFALQSFRTSKAQGSGLGLVTAQKMLAAYGATLSFQSPAGPFASCVTIQGKLAIQSQEKDKTLS